MIDPTATRDKSARSDDRFYETEAVPTPAIVVVPIMRNDGQDTGSIQETRGIDAKIDEAVGLAAAINLNVVASMAVTLTKITPATLIGSGKVAQIAERIKADEVELAIVDQPISPGQQRNLERAWQCKVLDRTGLILEIFGERARTREGRLQVEHAHLTWQKSRLVRSWTHLERQRGGFGFLGGPGETQIEADRRMIQTRLLKIEKDLDSVRRTRGLHRKTRHDVPFPVVALVGYTNAGKSTLFNALTASSILAEDMLFATLDPTLRRLDLPHGQRAILSDTVGFISELPTMLVAAFRATLEEVEGADIILHVRDISAEDSDFQASDVLHTLAALGIDQDDPRIIEVWNKIDDLSDDRRGELAGRLERREAARRPIMISALTGEGLEPLCTRIADAIRADNVTFHLTLEAGDGADRHWLYTHCAVLERRDEAETGRMHFIISVPKQQSETVVRRFGDLARRAGNH